MVGWDLNIFLRNLIIKGCCLIGILFMEGSIEESVEWVVLRLL